MVRLVDEGSRESKKARITAEEMGEIGTAELLHGESGMQDVTARAGHFGDLCAYLHIYTKI